MQLLPRFFGYTSTDYTTASTTTVDAGAAVALILITLFFVLISYVIGALLLGRVFKKAGVETWKAWVPVYNSWITLELGGQKGYWSILMFVPFVNIAAAVFMYIAYYHIGLRLGKQGEFVLWAIFLPIVWLVWLALDNSTWTGPVASVQQPQTPPAFAPPAQQ